MANHVIGIIGPIAAGKDIAGQYLAHQLGLPVYQISAPLKEICAGMGMELTRENLVALGTKLAAEKGESYLAEYIVAKAPEDRIIITGMRQLAQIHYLQSSAGLTLVSIDAQPSLRYERAKTGSRVSEASTLEEFIADEQAENSPPNVQRLFECMKLADHHITNNGSFEELHAALDSLIQQL